MCASLSPLSVLFWKPFWVALDWLRNLNLRLKTLSRDVLMSYIKQLHYPF